MRIIQQIIALCLMCLYIPACTIAQTRPGMQELSILDGTIEMVSYHVEVAKDTASRRRGLMYREVLPANQGMLLDYRRLGRMAIWMKNTYVPLDILFIDANGVIVKIHEGAEPLSTKRIESGSEVRAVLEINAGQVRRYGLRAGNRVRHASFRND